MDATAMPKDMRDAFEILSKVQENLANFSSDMQKIRAELSPFQQLIPHFTAMQEQLNSLQQQLNDLPPIPPFPTMPAPTPASPRPTASPTPTTPHTTPSASWATVTSRHKPQRKQPLSEKRLQATARAFSAPTTRDPATNGYEFIYLHRSRRLNRREIRYRFSLLGIESSRLIDITFPARSVTGILIHKEFTKEFLERLKTADITTLPDFDPLDHTHIIDPSYQDMSLAERTRFAKAINQDRCLRSLQYTRDYLVPSLAKYYVSIDWIPQTVATSILQARTPKPHTRRHQLDPKSATATFLKTSSFVPPTTADTDMQEAGEDFHPDAFADTDDESPTPPTSPPSPTSS